MEKEQQDAYYKSAVTLHYLHNLWVIKIVQYKQAKRNQRSCEDVDVGGHSLKILKNQINMTEEASV